MPLNLWNCFASAKRQNNVAIQDTFARGGALSTVIANGVATAGNTFGRGKSQK